MLNWLSYICTDVQLQIYILDVQKTNGNFANMRYIILYVLVHRYSRQMAIYNSDGNCCMRCIKSNKAINIVVDAKILRSTFALYI